MINDNPKPNKVDMHGIQKKGPGAGVYDGPLLAFLFLLLVLLIQFRQHLDKKNTHTIDCKTKVAPKI